MFAKKTYRETRWLERLMCASIERPPTVNGYVFYTPSDEYPIFILDPRTCIWHRVVQFMLLTNRQVYFVCCYHEDDFHAEWIELDEFDRVDCAGVLNTS